MSSRKFDPKNLEKLNSPKRLEAEDPEKVAEVLSVHNRQNIVDIGAGTGFYALPFSKRLGPDSILYALDIAQEMLDWIQETTPKEDAKKLKTLLMSENLIPLPDEFADLAFTANTFHEFHKPKKILVEIKRILRLGGELAVLDWKKEKMDFGPPYEIRYSLEELKQSLEDEGLNISLAYESFPLHNLIIGKKSY